MDPERWRHIEKLYESVVERSPAERAALLAEADPDVRAEVEVLLAQPSGGALLDQHAADLLGESNLTQLAAGAQLGHYQIVAMLGQGGMGVVYRARDTKLGREVAIKVLPDSLAEDPDRLARFNREAKLLASLNHPNIGHIYGVESQALVMELVEGVTLASLIRPGPLQVETALDYARQIAEALEAAHEKGIIHRDLKPPNIMVTPAGAVKVLDFGLAKAEEPVAASDPAESPTAMLSPTRSGVILGTAAYMSPEQARGDSVDKRTDIWAFGVVLYEMLTGGRAFPGETVTDVLAGILRGEPDWSGLPRATPLGIRKLLRRCLERERKQRLQAIGDARIEIEAALAEESDSSIVVSLIKKHKKGAIGSFAFVAALVGATWFLMHRPLKPSAELTQRQLTLNSSENPVGSEEISPDGMYLAYSDPAGIHVRLLSTGEERLIPSPAGVRAGADWVVASWFPDGTQLLADAFEDSGRMTTWAVSVLGQSPRELREGAAGCDVSPDGTHIAFRPLGDSDHFREIWVMGIQGDTPHKVIAAGENESLICVRWSTDGHRLAYIRNLNSLDRLQSSMETCDLKGANRTVVVPADRDLCLVDFHWFPEGRIVYGWKKPSGSDSYLSQVAIDNHAGTPNGKPKRITQWAGSDVRGLSASADGKRLVLQKRTHQFQVYLGELAAGGTRMKPPQRLTNNEANEWPTAWTADSKAMWIASNRNGTYGIYKQGISQQTSEPIITGLPDIPFFRLSADAAWILFVDPPRTAANPPPPERLMRIPASGGVPQLMLEIRNLVDFRCAPSPASLCVISEMSPDKKHLMITAFDPVKGRGRVLRTIDDDSPHPYGSALSPDGSTLAVSHPEEPRILIRLLSLSGGSDREITVKGWSHITSLDWSPDGKGLHCVSVSPQGSTLLYVDMRGNARVLWQYKGGSGPIWSVPSPDGRYLAILAHVNNENVWMVEGF
jgi:serine/threonine protein kinase